MDWSCRHSWRCLLTCWSPLHCMYAGAAFNWVCSTYQYGWYGMVWYGMVWYGMVWYGVGLGRVWYGMGDVMVMVWYGWYGGWGLGARVRVGMVGSLVKGAAGSWAGDPSVCKRCNFNTWSIDDAATEVCPGCCSKGDWRGFTFCMDHIWLSDMELQHTSYKAADASPWGAPVLVLIDAADRHRASLESLAGTYDIYCNPCRQQQGCPIRI